VVLVRNACNIVLAGRMGDCQLNEKYAIHLFGLEENV